MGSYYQSLQAPTGRPNLIHLVDNRGRDALIAFLDKDDRKIRRRVTNTHHKPWEKRVLYKEKSSVSPPAKRVLLRNVFNKPSWQLRPRIKMRKDDNAHQEAPRIKIRKEDNVDQEAPMVSETAVIPTVAFLSRLAETTWKADPFRARRFIEIRNNERE